MCQNDNKEYNTHTQPLMKQLRILSVPDMLLLNSMKFYYKYKRNEVQDYFSSINLHTQGSSLDYNTRQRDDIMKKLSAYQSHWKMPSGLFAENDKFYSKSNVNPYRHPQYGWICVCCKTSFNM